MKKEYQSTSIRTAAILIASVLLVICGDGKADDFGNFENEQKAEGRANCKKGIGKGISALAMIGKPGDAFRVIYQCGNREVSRCTATIAQGKTKASCRSQPASIPNKKAKRCQVGPKNGNSPAAKVVAVTCW